MPAIRINFKKSPYSGQLLRSVEQQNKTKQSEKREREEKGKEKRKEKGNLTPRGILFILWTICSCCWSQRLLGLLFSSTLGHFDLCDRNSRVDRGQDRNTSA